VSILGIIVLILGTGGAKIGTMGNDFNGVVFELDGARAEFIRGGFVHPSNSHVIINSSAQLESHINQIMAEFLKDDAEVPTGYWENIEANLRESYARFDANFFESHKLVIALVGQGSGNVTYNLKNVMHKDGILILDIEKQAPMMMTMDFISWLLHLDLCNEKFAEINSVRIIETVACVKS